MTLRIVLGLAVAGAIWSPAQAGPDHAAATPAAEYARCLATTAQRGGSTAKCEQQKYRSADKALNDAYQQLATKVDPEAKDPLDRAQRAWLNYRDSECAYEAARPAAGGASAPVVEARCMTRLTELRTQDVQQMLGAGADAPPAPRP